MKFYNCRSGVTHSLPQHDPIQMPKHLWWGLSICSTGDETDAKILQASTSEVADPIIHPQPESYWGNVNPQVGYRSCYDEGDVLKLVYGHAVESDCIKIIRIFTIYGLENVS